MPAYPLHLKVIFIDHHLVLVDCFFGRNALLVKKLKQEIAAINTANSPPSLSFNIQLPYYLYDGTIQEQ